MLSFSLSGEVPRRTAPDPWAGGCASARDPGSEVGGGLLSQRFSD